MVDHVHPRRAIQSLSLTKSLVRGGSQKTESEYLKILKLIASKSPIVQERCCIPISHNQVFLACIHPYTFGMPSCLQLAQIASSKDTKTIAL